MEVENRPPLDDTMDVDNNDMSEMGEMGEVGERIAKNDGPDAFPRM